MNPVTIIGAGLAGALAALFLARRGFAVEVFERRNDPRRVGYVGGRSINLALAERGMHALRLAGLEKDVLEQAVMMRGRMVHDVSGATQLLRYGRDDSEVIWSINRGRLNMTVLDAAEKAGAKVHFDRRLTGVDFATNTLLLADDATGETHARVARGPILGADGAGSALRIAMDQVHELNERFEPLGHGYKELEIPAAPGARLRDGNFLIERNALHIWPRGGYMCIALPNANGSFTVTLFLPNEGDPSFATVKTGADARALFTRDFPDALELIPDLEADFDANPTGLLGTQRLARWHLDGRALLIGDAAHAMVPFHGQGMNCAFEDCVELDALAAEGVLGEAQFVELELRRRPNAEAIQDMALENYIEMRDRVDDADFLLQKQLERVLADRHPQRFVPRYSLVTFMRVPYSVAQARGAVQTEILVEATKGLARLDQVDLAAADKQVLARIPPLA